MTGKWDLGRALGDEHMPDTRGFERSFALTTGTAVHLGFPDEDASSGIDRADPYPYREDGAAVTSLPADFFSTDFYTNKLIEYIESDKSDDQPFFAWLAYTAPHLPIQLPDDWRDRYAGLYDDGYISIRDLRFTKAKELGVFPGDLDLSRFQPQAPEWNSLNEAERQAQRRVMELYAAMVENMDHNVGRLMSYLQETEQLDNTVVLFLSDNGAAGGRIPVQPNFESNNELENMGRYDSWLEYGHGWAEAGTAPFRDTKGSMAEGGTRVPAFINGSRVTARGELDHGYLTIMDIAPTILEVTGIDSPGLSFEGRNVTPITGKSFWGRALGVPGLVHGPDEAIGWELHGSRALVLGKWKALMPDSTGKWELFNLVDDPGEANDLAELHPERLADLVSAWEEFATNTGVVY